MTRQSDTRQITGGGPWTFEPDEIQPGDSYQLDLRNMTYNNQRGFFRQYIPLDVLLVTNDSDEVRVRVDISHEFGGVVYPGSQKSFDETPISNLRFENVSSVPISSPELLIELQRSSYDADEAARERATEGPMRRVIRNFTGL